jgi:hypothetical protein
MKISIEIKNKLLGWESVVHSDWLGLAIVFACSKTIRRLRGTTCICFSGIFTILVFSYHTQYLHVGIIKKESHWPLVTWPISSATTTTCIFSLSVSWIRYSPLLMMLTPQFPFSYLKPSYLYPEMKETISVFVLSKPFHVDNHFKCSGQSFNQKYGNVCKDMKDVHVHHCPLEMIHNTNKTVNTWDEPPHSWHIIYQKTVVTM